MLFSSWKLNECNLSCKIAEKLQNHRGPVIIYGPGRRRILGGITWFLGEQKGGSVVLENAKGEITENFGRITEEGEPIKFAWMDLWKRKVNYVAMFLVVCQLSRDVIVYEDS